LEDVRLAARADAFLEEREAVLYVAKQRGSSQLQLLTPSKLTD
jgi:hypothetical protein